MVLSLDRFVGKVAIVTGASAGIGASISQRLVESGVIVAGFARRSEKIEENAKKISNPKGKLYAVKVDMTKEEDILKGFKWVIDNLGPIHILVNNAGIIRYGSIVEQKTEEWLEVFKTNVIGLSIATREAVKNMKENNISGHIIHLNSIIGHTVFAPRLSMYGPSKWAVTALTETLRQEFNFQKLKIKVTSISPGAVETEIMDVSGFPTDYYKELKRDPEDHPILEAEDVSDAILYALSTPPHVQVHELIIKPVNEEL